MSRPQYCAISHASLQYQDAVTDEFMDSEQSYQYQEQSYSEAPMQEREERIMEEEF